MNYLKSVRRKCLALVPIIFLLVSVQAHADFRKALDAYIARDGDTLLKEVKEAVDSKNNDGLMLFVNALRIDEVAFSKRSSDISSDHNKCMTIQKLLNSSQIVELERYIETLVSTSDVNTKYLYYFKRNSRFTSEHRNFEEASAELERLANLGSMDAAVELLKIYGVGKKHHPELARFWFIKAAELGDTYSMISLAFNYLGYNPRYFLSTTSCEHLKINGTCFEKDFAAGNFWLNKAIQSVDTNPLYMRRFALEMGNLYVNGVDGSLIDFRQAYLWYVLALNSPDISNFGVSEDHIIGQIKLMYEKNQLSQAEPKLDKVWNKFDERNQILFPKKEVSLPSLLLEARNQELDKDEPAFIYLHVTEDVPYQIQVFKNGKVRIGLFMQMIMSDYMQISTNTLQEFFVELQLLISKNNRLSISSRTGSSYWCDVCKGDDTVYAISDSSGRNTYYIGYDKNDKIDSNIKNKISEIATLVEKFFPTEKIRFGIGNSKIDNNQCVTRKESNF